MYVLRSATVDDVDFLMAVVLEATRDQGRPSPEDDPEWRAGYADWSRRMIVDDPSVTSVIEVDGHPAGRLRVARDPGSIELCGLQLLPAVQNQGIGTAIIRQLQQEAADRGVPVELSVEHDNPNARRLYDRLGFVKYAEDDTEAKLRWSGDGVPTDC